MGLDANGIWQYDESETAAPVSTVLNRLAQSVSDVVAPISHDTGWVNVATALASPWTSTLKVRRIGDLVTWKGTVDPNSTHWGAINNAQTIANISAGGLNLPEFIPVDTVPKLCAANTANSSAVAFRATIQSNGLIVGRCNTTNYAFGICLEVQYLVN
jgi:hypothetical protein